MTYKLRIFPHLIARLLPQGDLQIRGVASQRGLQTLWQITARTTYNPLMRGLFFISLIFISSCGFHLRGSVELPPELSEIRVEDAGGASLIAPDLRDALRDRGIMVVDKAGMILQVQGESYGKRVLSVDSSGRATEYSLSYTVRFRLQTMDGVAWMSNELIAVQRDLRFDASAVLATAGEETLLQEEMRRDAVLQILRRLQYAKPPMQEEMNQGNVIEDKE